MRWFIFAAACGMAFGGAMSLGLGWGVDPRAEANGTRGLAMAWVGLFALARTAKRPVRRGPVRPRRMLP